MPIDLYETLQISPSSCQKVIEAAYKVLGKSKDTDLAYETLSDKTKRENYDAERLETKKIIGSFRIISPLAVGGYGRTYLGEHILTGKKVCIKHCKRLDPEYQQILIDEWNTICDLPHYELPAMKDLVKLPDNTIALISSFIPGLTLAQLVEKHGKLDYEDVAWIAQRCLNVLRYLHDHGVIHGDIKPSNIIIREEDHTIALIDFGLSVSKPQSTTQSKGYTEYYSPPEQMQKKALLPESDFYALGMTMIYALSGQHECVQKRQVPTDVPAPLCDFIVRLIKKDVMDRPRWETENLCRTIEAVRQKAFGRIESRMKPIGKPDRR